jgi:two-component system, chemotaxis family, CheB/CheR fusion protein
MGNLRELTERALLLHYVQAGVLVNSRGEILHIYGRTGKYLEPAPGDAGMNILTMAREGLRRELTTGLHRAVTRKEHVDCRGLRVKNNGEFITVNLTVQPAASLTAGTAVRMLILHGDVSGGTA